MRKKLVIIQLIAIGLFLSTASYASGGDRGHHRGHRNHHNDHNDQRGYYPQPQPSYYGPQPYQDPRSHQGLAGGVVGSVLGYEMGKGDPIATGLGAAAGSFIGNGISGRR